MEESKGMTLAALGDGAAEEMFDAELQKVLANIDDPNVRSDAKREVLLRVSLTPTKDRATCAVAITVESKLTGRRPHEGTAYLGYDIQAKRFIANLHNPRQARLFGEGGSIPQISEEQDRKEEN